MPKKCTDCSNCLLQDYGYSSLTVEGTLVVCMLRLHTNGDFDSWYGKDVRQFYAEECKQFSEGKAEELDVDYEKFSDLTEQAQQYLKGR